MFLRDAPPDVPGGESQADGAGATKAAENRHGKSLALRAVALVFLVGLVPARRIGLPARACQAACRGARCDGGSCLRCRFLVARSGSEERALAEEVVPEAAAEEVRWVAAGVVVEAEAAGEVAEAAAEAEAEEGRSGLARQTRSVGPARRPGTRRPGPESGGTSALGARRGAIRAAGRGGGGACTTTGLLPVASDRAAGGESSVLTTSAGSVTAAASAAPMSAAKAIIARLLFTFPLVLPNHSSRGIGAFPQNLNCR